MKIKILIILTLLNAQLSVAKNWDGYADRAISIRAGFVSPAIHQYLSNPENPQAKRVQYDPNVSSKFGLGVSYGKIGLSATFASAPDANTEERLGKTKAQDYQLRFFGDVHTYDIFYQRYSGFFIRNSSEVDPAYATRTDSIKRPDLDIEHYGIQYFYNFESDNFHPGYFDQSAIPRTSGGALLGFLGFNHHRFSADSTLVPTTLAGTYGEFENFKSGEFQTIKTGLAAGYCLVSNGIYVALMGLLAGGQQLQKYELATVKKEKTLPQFSSSAKLSTGYNSRNFFFALNIISDNTIFRIENADVSASTTDVSLWLGSRF